MPLSGYELDNIGEVEIQRLVESGASEHPRFDVKGGELPGKTGDERRKFLREIVSFANADGGDLVFGAVDQDGIVVEVPGWKSDNAERDVNALVDSARNNIDPRISGLRFHPIPLANGNHVLVIRIPKSPDGPHMVTYSGTNQYWLRTGMSKAPMSAAEVARAVTYSHDLQRRYLEYSERRLQQLKENTGPAEMHGRPYYFVLMAPLAPVTGIDFADRDLYQQLLNVGPPHKSSFNPWMTFEGLLLSPAKVGRAAYSYRLCGTNGIIEACIAKGLEPPGTDGVITIEIERVESDLVELAEDNYRVLKAMSIPPPYVVIAALSGIKDWRLVRIGLDSYRLEEDNLPLRFDDYMFPPLVLAEPIDDLTSALSPILTRLWHMAGHRSRPTR